MRESNIEAKRNHISNINKAIASLVMEIDIDMSLGKDFDEQFSDINEALRLLRTIKGRIVKEVAENV